jgi:ectoine hydroxylase-related dioxygenase (phytanoyl-CoA dioxygenase family)
MIEVTPFRESFATESSIELRSKFSEDGYLLIKGAIDPSLCKSLLKIMIAVMKGKLEMPEDSWSPVLVGDPFVETDKAWDRIYPELQSLEVFHQFFHTSEVLTLMGRILNADPFVYPMKMARIATPRKSGFETPAHQDAYSHHAGPTMAGIWVALHDVDETMGRLAILDRSHLKGVREVVHSPGVGGVQCKIFSEEKLWHVSNVECGDVILFSSQTVHRAEPNTSENKVRVSVDTRFCDYGSPVFSTNLEPHHGWRIDRLNWEYIYKNWTGKTLKYYWLNYENVF